MKGLLLLLLLATASLSQCYAFTTMTVTKAPMRTSSMTRTSTSNDDDSDGAGDVMDATTAASDSTTTTSATDDLYIPLSLDEMIRQCSDAMKDAFEEDGVNRQIVRVLLPRAPDNDQLLQYVENDASFMDPRDMVLVPPDETWQGGAMQLYRAASLACRAVLRRLARDTSGGVPPKLVEDRSVDDSGVDGIGLWMTQGSVAAEDISCFVQPSQETVPAISAISNQAGSKRLVALMNPQWRMVDDALDSASKSGGVLGAFASFLGGKGGALKTLSELGYKDVYILEGYVCRGGNVRLLKTYRSDWVVFAENDAGTDFVKVGTSWKTRPTYQDVDGMLSEQGISLKYARDIGLAPKL